MTVAKRQADLRRRRAADGWKEVRVWVPSDADAERLRADAAKMRRAARSAVRDELYG